jgi:hypothetical protein
MDGTPTVRHTPRPLLRSNDRCALLRGPPEAIKEGADGSPQGREAGGRCGRGCRHRGSFFVGLSQVATLSLAVLGATLVVVVLVLALTGYKVIDRLLNHLERYNRPA